MAQRLTYRRRHSYKTSSNLVRVVKTPGGVLRYIYQKKAGTVPKCGDCSQTLIGLPALRPKEWAGVSKTKKSVNRAYGGSRCGTCVRDRILRAFLLEEQKIVKRMVKAAPKA
ncbi:50S ribosomal protein L34e [Capsaspora owczarzaki ATCC 30864]|uniref:50S ribosomal protein L34e n=1 Tax=Capsaspora owczarzaki (strain ATCC 30864) TaxID=595528 RepID=A0A0D2VHR7_CAPO3|nr:50S ribosomal protein L34e [Capsaspora owczarzaki ATCC 30864]KJE89487.1 50S ribosomal protein L34e [Capsaspora owczarzaki ATCC 30864]|eukprot:XP_011270028.1 50S ribosomal protein L34e [Capsaspora owczarzaki ATCC 30864]